MDLFAASWAALRAGVADHDFAAPSGCAGWLVITLVTPAETEATHDAASYWTVADTPPTGDDPLDALTVRLAAAYQDPALLTFHVADIGSAAGRAARLADPEMLVSTQEMVLTAADYLSAYVLEWTLHHLDLTAHLPHRPGPPAEGLAATRALLERIAGAAFPASWPDREVLLVGTGRREPTETQRAELGALAARIPFVLC